MWSDNRSNAASSLSSYWLTIAALHLYPSRSHSDLQSPNCGFWVLWSFDSAESKAQGSDFPARSNDFLHGIIECTLFVLVHLPLVDQIYIPQATLLFWLREHWTLLQELSALFYVVCPVRILSWWVFGFLARVLLHFDQTMIRNL